MGCRHRAMFSFTGRRVVSGDVATLSLCRCERSRWREKMGTVLAIRPPIFPQTCSPSIDPEHFEQVSKPLTAYRTQAPCSENGSRTRRDRWHAGIGACIALPRGQPGGSAFPSSVDPFRPRVYRPYCSKCSSSARFASPYSSSSEPSFPGERH